MVEYPFALDVQFGLSYEKDYIRWKNVQQEVPACRDMVV
jgi:hypothetical protein